MYFQTINAKAPNILHRKGKQTSKDQNPSSHFEALTNLASPLSISFLPSNVFHT